MGWSPGFLASLSSISGNQSRLADLDITVAACLTAQALNATYAPIAVKGVPALERRRLALVRADPTFKGGKLVERPDEHRQPEAA